MADTIYSVHDTGQGILKIVDVQRGTQAGIISPRGKLVTPPIVNGNSVSFIVEDPDGQRQGNIHSLPGGQLSRQFRA